MKRKTYHKNTHKNEKIKKFQAEYESQLNKIMSETEWNTVESGECNDQIIKALVEAVNRIDKNRETRAGKEQ